MKVVFVEEVKNVAKAGDVREVKNGYARNYLFPRNLAVLATSDQLDRVEALRRAESLRQGNSEARAELLGPLLEGLSITIKARSGSAGRLYGSVSALSISEELSRSLGQEFSVRDIELPEPIKALGTYNVIVNLSPSSTSSIVLEVIEEDLSDPSGASKIKATHRPKKEYSPPVESVTTESHEEQVINTLVLEDSSESGADSNDPAEVKQPVADELGTSEGSQVAEVVSGDTSEGEALPESGNGDTAYDELKSEPEVGIETGKEVARKSKRKNKSKE